MMNDETGSNENRWHWDSNTWAKAHDAMYGEEARKRALSKINFPKKKYARPYDAMKFSNGAEIHMCEAPFLKAGVPTNAEYIEENDIHTVYVLLTNEDMSVEYGKGYGLLHAYKRLGLEVVHFPIQDYSTPHDMQGFAKVVDQVISKLKHKENVLIHCMGGKGRTGIVVVGVLVRLGKPVDEALAYARKIRPLVETPEQERFLSYYKKYLERSKEE